MHLGLIIIALNGGWVIFINEATDLTNAVTGHYSWGLVILSIVVAIFTSYVAFAYSERYRVSYGNIKKLWLTFGSFVMGLGVWSMHFIGMLAYKLPFPVAYDIQITILSIIPAILAAVAMHIVIAKEQINYNALIIGGTIMGAGIGTMHYTGMMAMHFDGYMAYNPIIFELSIIVAIVFSIFAISLKHILKIIKINSVKVPIYCCVIMGIAISGMHYMGMLATSFFTNPNVSAQGLELVQSNNQNLSFIIAFSIVFILGLAFISTIIDRKFSHATEKAQYSQARLEAVMENVMDGIITVNNEGIMFSFNPAAEKIFGYKKEQVIGNNIEMLMEDNTATKHSSFIRRYLRTGKSKVIGTKSEFTAKRSDGTLFPIEISITEMWVEGTSNFVASFRDITKRKADEEEMQKMLLQQTRQAKEASDANKMKSGFLANMSHELRTPLNVIMGITELLKEDAEMDGRDDLIDPLSRVLKSSKHLLQLINDILDLSKIEAGKIDLHIETFDFNSMVEEITTTCEVLAQNNNNKFNIKVEDSLPNIKGDMMRLKQILMNLLSNSFKFTNEGNVILDVAVEQKDDHGSKWITFKVTDTGIGMTEEQVSQLFQEFVQADSSTTKKFGGTGLGLAISKALAELMGGNIEVSSVFEQGTTFEVKLPLPN